MNIKEIKELVELLDGTDIAEIKISKGDESIRITKPTLSKGMGSFAPVQQMAPQIVNSQPLAEATSNPVAAQTLLPAKSILSPMVGTFYSAPKP